MRGAGSHSEGGQVVKAPQWRRPHIKREATRSNRERHVGRGNMTHGKGEVHGEGGGLDLGNKLVIHTLLVINHGALR